MTKTTLVNVNPLELVTTGQPIVSDLDLPCAFSATCTPLEGLGEVTDVNMVKQFYSHKLKPESISALPGRHRDSTDISGEIGDCRD
jgi:hypothetical protein